MKVLSIQQPWASLIVAGHKKIETRSWNTKYRGELLIHASMKAPDMGICLDEPFVSILAKDGLIGKQMLGKSSGYFFPNMPLGKIIGKVNLYDTCKSDVIKSAKTISVVNVTSSLDVLKDITAPAFGAERLPQKSWQISEQELSFGDYSAGRYGWLLSNPVQFKHPILSKGKLGLWNYEFDGNDQSFVMQCADCGYTACSDAFPLDKSNIDTDEEDWDVWCPKCECRELDLIIENLPY